MPDPMQPRPAKESRPARRKQPRPAWRRRFRPISATDRSTGSWNGRFDSPWRRKSDTSAQVRRQGNTISRCWRRPGLDAKRLFEEALAADAQWPIHRARVLLAYGTWLRRKRHVAESRSPLRAAREAFDAIGVAPWAQRARQELGASGEASQNRAPSAWDQLTPQELQIVQMAAEGLSNRDIGQRLFLSHRTVGSHLYRTFPKLGVASRGALSGALQAASFASSDAPVIRDLSS